MKFVNNKFVVIVFASLLFLPALAEETDTGWKDTAELSYVVTAGNSDTSTLGFKNVLSKAWEKSALTFKLGGVRAESTRVTDFFAIDTGPSPTIVRTESDDLTAENYYFNGRYDRKITDRFFWHAGAGWDRNRFAGIQNRYIGFAGVGNIWTDTDKIKFNTTYAVTFTDQEDVVVVPGADDSFLGLRGTWTYLHNFTDTVTYGNDLILDLNVDETDDWRADMINSLAVKLSDRLALKVGLQWLYDNMPAFTVVDLYDTDPRTDPGAVVIGTQAVELDELDTVFSTALVVNF